MKISINSVLAAFIIFTISSCVKPELGEIVLPPATGPSVPATPTAFYVSPSGNDANAGTFEAPFKTLEKARDVMRTSAIKKVYLRAGVYNLSSPFLLTDKDNKTLWAVYPNDPMNSAIVDGNGLSDIIDILGGSDITINGLTVRNFTARGIGVHGGAGYGPAAPYFDKTYSPAERNVISNNIIENGVIKAPCWDRAGIHTEGTTPKTIITNNVVRNTTGYGIGVWALENGDNITGTEVKNNVVLNTGSSTKDGGAIYVIDDKCQSSNITIKNNFIRDYGRADNESRGIYLDNALSNALVEGNVISGAGSDPILLHGGSNITLTRNIIDLGSAGNRPVVVSVIYRSGRMSNNKIVNNIILSSNTSNTSTTPYIKYGAVESPYISQNLYFDYIGGMINTGAKGELPDASPIFANPLISGHVYEVAANSRLFSAPFNLTANVVKYGPQGYSIPASGSLASSLIAAPKAVEIYQAENYNSMSGVSKTATSVGSCDGGDWVKYDKIDFGTGATRFTASVAVDKSYEGQTIEVRLGSPTGQLLSSLKVASTGGWEIYREQSAAMTSVKGVQSICLVFKGGSGVGNLNYFKFE